MYQQVIAAFRETAANHAQESAAAVLVKLQKLRDEYLKQDHHDVIIVDYLFSRYSAEYAPVTETIWRDKWCVSVPERAMYQEAIM